MNLTKINKMIYKITQSCKNYWYFGATCCLLL